MNSLWGYRGCGSDRTRVGVTRNEKSLPSDQECLRENVLGSTDRRNGTSAMRNSSAGENRGELSASMAALMRWPASGRSCRVFSVDHRVEVSSAPILKRSPLLHLAGGRAVCIPLRRLSKPGV